MKRKGLEIRDLLYIDFNNYKQQDYEVKNLSKELQQLRWDEYEKSRQEMINDAKEVII